MKISTKGRYALRLMLELALHSSGGCMPLRDISQRQNISVKYLEQIVLLLSRAGLVKSTRGPQGGYELTRSPEDYTVGTILRLTEGSLAPVACLEEEANRCLRSEECATLEVFRRLDDAIRSVVDSVTLADLVDIQHSKTGGDYVI